MFPPTPAIPRFEHNSLLLDTSLDFGDDMSIGEMLPPTPRANMYTSSTPRESPLESTRSAAVEAFVDHPDHTIEAVEDVTLCLDEYMPSDIAVDTVEMEEEPVRTEGVLAGREKLGGSGSSSRTISSSKSTLPSGSASTSVRSDDYYARRLSSSRSSSPFISSNILPTSSTPINRQPNLPSTYRPAIPRSSSNLSNMTAYMSDDEPSRVQLAWRSRPPNASRASVAASSNIAASTSRVAANGSIKKPSSGLPVKQKTSALGRYLARSAVLKSEAIVTAASPEATAESEEQEGLRVIGSASASNTLGLEISSTLQSPPVPSQSLGDIVASCPIEAVAVSSAPPTSTHAAEEECQSKVNEDAPQNVDETPSSSSPIATRYSSPSNATTSHPIDAITPVPVAPVPRQRPATPPALPLLSTKGTATTPFGIPIPHLVDFSEEEDTSPDESMDSSRSDKYVKEPRSDLARSRSGLVDFFTGFLRGSTSTAPRHVEEGQTAQETEKVQIAPVEVDSGSKDQAVRAQLVPKQASLKPSATTQPAMRKAPLPGYIPLTRPSTVKPAPTAASSARVLQPSRNVTNAIRQTAQAGPSKPTAKPEPTRKPPIPSFSRPTASSAFAKAALAKLPPPGKGSSAASKPIRVRTPERAHNIASRRKVFERTETTTQPSSIRTSSAPKPRSTMARTIPMAGKTPGKASRARAAERDKFDEALKARNAEKERQRLEMAKRREEEEEEEYLRRRKETVIWAKPVPEIYKRGEVVRS